MTKYDKPLQSGMKQNEEARKQDRPGTAVKRELSKARAPEGKRGAARRGR